jgi:translation initiation factor IF-3
MRSLPSFRRKWIVISKLGGNNIAAEKPTRLNEQITVPKVRLIDAEGNQVGIVPIREALLKAQESELDLVEISPTAKPPVCRVMDYGKFLFEVNKKRQVAKKKQKQVQIKEIKFRPGTDEGDYQVKLRNLTRFLEEGDKAKITLRFRGREMTHQEIGLEVLARIEKDLTELGVVEQRPKMEGKQMVMVISPKKKD